MIKIIFLTMHQSLAVKNNIVKAGYMNNYILELNDEQKNKLGNYRDFWYTIALSTEKANRPLAEQAVIEAYKRSGLGVPENFIWFMSPMQGVIAAYILSQIMTRIGLQPRGQIRVDVQEQVTVDILDQVQDQLRNEFLIRVHEQVRMEIWELFGDRAWNTSVSSSVNKVFKQVIDQVSYHTHEKLWDQVDEKNWFSIGDAIREQAYKCGSGSYDASWLSVYVFFLDECQLGSQSKLQLLMDLCQHCGWWWTYKKAVVLTERPNYIGLDDRGALHALGRKAVEYPDGWGLWRVYGVQVPEDWASKQAKDWESRWLFQTDNAELRRVIIQVLGYERIMKELKSKLIHAERNMELRIIQRIDVEPIQLLKVICPSTDREYVLRVPPHFDNCEQARRWTLFDEDYAFDFVIET